MKFRLPEDCTGISHDGQQLAVADDGTVAADPAAAPDLAAHGLVAMADKPAGTDKPVDPAKSGRQAR